MSGERPCVLILGGGPDAEREVSLKSSQTAAAALEKSARFRVHREVIGRITADELRALPGDVIFPILHGPFGEGGPMQDILEADGRPYVGSGPRAARVGMDKAATKILAAQLGIATPPAAIFNAADCGRPVQLPVVIKPVHEGSSVGLHICKDQHGWNEGVRLAAEEMRDHPGRVYMIEKMVVGGRELTVGLLDGVALRPLEIKPKSGIYDYDAKYQRNDTVYLVGPDLPPGVEQRIRAQAEDLGKAMGVRHLARVDFLLDDNGTPWLLEINTMPGFTEHSLLPMAARDAGLDFAALAERLVELALRDAGRDAVGPR